MIAELIRSDDVLLGLEGDFHAALARLVERLGLTDRECEILDGLAASEARGFAFVSSDVAVPHVRLAGLAAPRLALGISRTGLAGPKGRARVVLLLLTQLEDPDRHLQLLARVAAALPGAARELVAARDGASAVKIVARAEERGDPASYVNLTDEQVAFELATDLASGLSTAEAARRLGIHGRNVFQHARRTPWVMRLARNLLSFFAILLWIATALCFVPGVDMPELGVAIASVTLVNGLFAFIQETKADRAVEMLARLLAPRARVIRDGTERQVDAADLVPGDVIVVEEGDLVPADARLVEADGVEVENASLTGEATSARRYKSNQPILLHGKFVWIELPNVVFAGSALVRGRGRAVVFGTGMQSEIGRIAGLTQSIRAEPSPLQKQLRGAVIAISWLAGGLGLAFLLVGWLLGGLDFRHAFVFFIGIFVANVPEGLLPTVTLALAMAVRRMAKRHALVKSLPSVETLGCATVICTDKTGTLTQNVMMVTRVYVDGELVTVSGTGYRPEGCFSFAGRDFGPSEIARRPALRRLLECAVVCNNARLEAAAGDYRVLGDPTEGALLALAAKAGTRGVHHRLRTNPFESVRKRMSVVVQAEGREARVVYAKGAPLELLERCDRLQVGREVLPLGVAERERIVAQHDSLASDGLRMLGLAWRELDDAVDIREMDADRAESGLVFLGLTAMSDPIRPGVAEAIRACHTAGIRIHVITGDYPLTATRIAREIGLGGGGELPVLTGAELSELDDAALDATLARGEVVFARVTPEHKLRIVTRLRALGEVVAVTGDGVNDAPALKRADIGIAMGLRGNDVAKEAAHVVLTDDNFASIVAAIEEGRAIRDNIRRFAAYVLNSNPQEMLPYVAWMLVPGMPLAMTVMGVLAVDVGTDLIPAMGLGIEPPEPGILERPPRRPNEPLLSAGFILRSYLVNGVLLALSCWLTYYFCGWVLGAWQPGAPLTAMPASPAGLDLRLASFAYLQTLTAYFFPTVTAQIANVLAKRSTRTSLFSTDFLPPARRSAILAAIRAWRPPPAEVRFTVDLRVGGAGRADTARALGALVSRLVWLPLALAGAALARGAAALDRPVLRPLFARTADFLERHPIVLNWISNPLVDLGILFELALCWFFFSGPLARVYGFAPAPWSVYLFAFHGLVLILAFEEAKKALRRRGHALEWLG